MAEWLIPVDPDVYDIDRAFNELPSIYWAKHEYDYQDNDLIYLYVSNPIGKIKYLFKVIGHASNLELPENDREYWIDKEVLGSYKGDYFIIQPIKKVDKMTLSRNYLISQGLISSADTLQSHKTTKFVKGKKSEQINAHKKLLAFIQEQFSSEKVDTDYPDEANLESTFFPEGAKTTVQVNRYERNPEARAKCLQIHGTRCHICTMSFEFVYGFFAKDFIHVHHIKPLHEISESYEVNPETDLIPVCPNCHAMLHKKDDNDLPMTVDQLKKLFSASFGHPQGFEF